MGSYILKMNECILTDNEFRYSHFRSSRYRSFLATWRTWKKSLSFKIHPFCQLIHNSNISFNDMKIITPHTQKIRCLGLLNRIIQRIFRNKTAFIFIFTFCGLFSVLWYEEKIVGPAYRMKSENHTPQTLLQFILHLGLTPCTVQENELDAMEQWPILETEATHHRLMNLHGTRGEGSLQFAVLHVESGFLLNLPA